MQLNLILAAFLFNLIMAVKA